MKRRTLIVLLAATTMVPLSLSAFADDTDEPTPQDRKQRDRVAGSNNDALAAEMRFAKQLRSAVMAELQLNEKQQEKIDELFKEHAELIEQVTKSTPPAEDKEARREQRERLRELESKAAAAREAGDREKAREYLREIRDIRRGKDGHMVGQLASANRQLIGDITELLDEEQLPPFRRAVRKVRASTEKHGPLRLLMRGVRDTMADLDLDKQQRKQVGGIVRKAMKEVDLAGDDPEAQGKLLGLLRADLTEEFDEELADEFVTKLDEAWKRLREKNTAGEAKKDKGEESEESPPDPEPDDEN